MTDTGPSPSRSSHPPKNGDFHRYGRPAPGIPHPGFRGCACITREYDGEGPRISCLTERPVIPCGWILHAKGATSVTCNVQCAPCDVRCHVRRATCDVRCHVLRADVLCDVLACDVRCDVRRAVRRATRQGPPELIRYAWGELGSRHPLGQAGSLARDTSTPHIAPARCTSTLHVARGTGTLHVARGTGTSQQHLARRTSHRHVAPAPCTSHVAPDVARCTSYVARGRPRAHC